MRFNEHARLLRLLRELQALLGERLRRTKLTTRQISSEEAKQCLTALPSVAELGTQRVGTGVMLANFRHHIPLSCTEGWPDRQTQGEFLGIPLRQIVATGTPDLRDSITRKLFARGLEKMLEVLQPRALILFGIPAKGFPIRKLVPRSCKLAIHPHRWQQLREALRNGPNRRRSK